MDLTTWERILQSDVAVAMLLFSAIAPVGALLLAWCRALHRENQELRRELINHLKSNADLDRVLERMDHVIDLSRRHALVPAPDHAPDPGPPAEG